MKLLPVLCVSAGATVSTSFDDAVAMLKARYNDMKLQRVDNSSKFLKKTTRKMARLKKRRKRAMYRKGCWADNLLVDFSLDIRKGGCLKTQDRLME